eukprot:SAG22_NODE_334_length_12094_cov_9.446019_10_plen_68_part_00
MEPPGSNTNSYVFHPGFLKTVVGKVRYKSHIHAPHELASNVMAGVDRLLLSRRLGLAKEEFTNASGC